MEEIWKDINGFEGHYQVSNRGNIRSIKKNPIILKGDLQRNGYKRVYLWLNNGKKNCLVHRLVAQTFIDNPYCLTDVNHRDENKINNNVENLEWCSHLDNMNYGTVKVKISNSNRGKIISDETRKKLKEDTSRRRWINNGTDERYVYLETLSSFLNQGWKRGRKIKERINNV